MKKSNLQTKTLEKKIKEQWRESLFKYEQQTLKKRLSDKLDTLYQRLPKLVATQWKKKKVKCFTCDKICTYSDLNWCHWISRKHKASRWLLWNIYPCCKWCNDPKTWKNQDHINTLTETIIETQWREIYRKYRYWINKEPDYFEMKTKEQFIEDKYKELGFERFLLK